jgi:hypothetical protein
VTANPKHGCGGEMLPTRRGRYVCSRCALSVRLGRQGGSAEHDDIPCSRSVYISEETSRDLGAQTMADAIKNRIG